METYRFVFDQVRSPGSVLQLEEVVLRGADGSKLPIEEVLNPGMGLAQEHYCHYFRLLTCAMHSCIQALFAS
jgi:hypothetical protein